jgi:hypothetical protein
MDEQGEGLLQDDATFVIDGVQVNPTGRGYTAVPNYAHYFWRPYLGNTAFALWELLLSFCYGDTSTVYPSITRLARMLTNSDHSRAVVTGRTRNRNGAACRDIGALDVLRRERLVQVVRRSGGQMSSYTFRVLKTLPVLRPDQVARLSTRLQRDHRVWLQRRGIDLAAYDEAFPTLDPAEPSARHPAARCTAAPAITLIAATGTSPCAQGTASAVPGSTNHPQEASLPNHWWQDALTELQSQLTRSTFEICLLRTQVQSFRDGVLTLRAAGPLPRDFLQHRLLPLIQRTLHTASHGHVRQVVVE